MSRRVAVIDDDAAVRQMLSDFLTAEGYDAQCLTTAEDLTPLHTFAPDVIVLDLHAEQLEAGKYIFDRFALDTTLRGARVIVCQADPTLAPASVSIESPQAQGYLVLSKPFDLDTLMHLIDQAVEGHHQQRSRSA